MNHPSIHSVLPPKRSHLSPGRTSQSSLPHEQLRLALQNKKGNVISKLVGSCKNMGQQSFAEIVVVVCPKKLSYLVSLLVDPVQRFSCHSTRALTVFSSLYSFRDDASRNKANSSVFAMDSCVARGNASRSKAISGSFAMDSCVARNVEFRLGDDNSLLRKHSRLSDIMPFLCIVCPQP